MEEVKFYCQNEYLYSNLQRLCEALLNTRTNNANKIFGFPDCLKLKSSITLFSIIDNNNQIYEKVLEKFFSGNKDSKTIEILHIL